MIAISKRGMKAHLLTKHKRVYLFNLNGNEDKEAESIMNDLLIPKKEYE